jgi:hypothetical protein
MAEKIYFNGKKYDNVSEMPSSVRQQYEKFDRFFADANQDGIPDVIQSRGISGLKETFNMIREITQMSADEGMTQEQLTIIRETDRGIYVNGKSYDSVSEMPSHIRQAYEKITNTAEVGGSDIYDEAWRDVERDEFFKPHDDEVLNRQMKGYAQTRNDNIEPVDSTSRFLFLMVAVILVFVIAALVWFIFF